MSRTEFCEILDTTEPIFGFRNVEYQICMVKGRILAGLADNEEEDQWFNTIEELLYGWKLQGIPLIDALSEITFD